MRKDADAVKALSDAEIHAVENGITNVDYPQKNSLKTRIYEILWEYDNYRNGGDPNGHSVVQRLEYWKTSLNLIKQHPLIGVGTGDINAAFEKEYAIEHSRLDKEHRLKAHNQYLSITVTFGIIGLLIFLFALIYPLLINRNYADFYYVVFWIFIMLSMFSEDTLETQAGLTFFIFFNTVFLFRKKEGGIGGLKF
jgi:O-antigen ligase